MDSTLIAIIIEFVMGILIGVFTDNDERITLWEGLLATAVFIAVNLTTYMIQPSVMVTSMIVILFMGWIAVWIGLFIGNATRHEIKDHLIEPWLESMTKKELQMSIADFLRTCSRIVYFNNPEDTTRLERSIESINKQFEQIINKLEYLANNSITNKFQQTLSLCNSYYELTISIIHNQASAGIIAEWTALGDLLEQVSHNNLEYAEEEMRKSITTTESTLKVLIAFPKYRFTQEHKQQVVYQKHI